MSEIQSSEMASSLKPYRLTLYEEKGDQHQIVFECDAEDAAHASEQAESAYPNCEVTDFIELPVTKAYCIAHEQGGARSETWFSTRTQRDQELQRLGGKPFEVDID